MVHEHALVVFRSVCVQRFRRLFLKNAHQLVLLTSSLLKLFNSQFELLLCELHLSALLVQFFVQLHLLATESRFLTGRLHIHHVKLFEVAVFLHQFLSDLSLRLVFIDS